MCRLDCGVDFATDAEAHVLSVAAAETQSVVEVGAAAAETAREFSFTTHVSSFAASARQRRSRHSEGASLAPPARDSLAERADRLRKQARPEAANMRTISFFTFEFMSA